jgi:hypothetical protein
LTQPATGGSYRDCRQPVAEDLRMALLELLRKVELEEDVDFLREGVRAMAQQLMELEVAQHIGADKYERAAHRTGERNGYRDRNGVSTRRIDDLVKALGMKSHLEEPVVNGLYKAEVIRKSGPWRSLERRSLVQGGIGDVLDGTIEHADRCHTSSACPLHRPDEPTIVDTHTAAYASLESSSALRASGNSFDQRLATIRWHGR